jgi:hypothetical protein
MKTNIKLLIISLIFISFVTISQLGYSQAPPPPPGEKGSGTNQSPMNGPIDGGLTIFLAFAAGYAGRIWIKSGKQIREME